MPEAIALGELLIDFVSLDRDRPLSALPRFVGAAGGSAANVAVGLARQGVTAGFIGLVGEDPFGQFLRETMETEGVEVSHLRVHPTARTTLAFLATRSDGRKDISFYRHPGADMMLSRQDVEAGYVREARLFHFGAVSLSRSPAREATLFAARSAHEAGLLVSYDPNWRPTLWDDPEEARRVIWEAMPCADVVHCAEEEWEFVTGTEELEAGAHRILSEGPDLVAVTQGPGGCYLDNGSVRGQIAGFTVEVTDATGAGDAFVAAMLAQLLRETTPIRELPEARLRAIIGYANAAGALTCTKPGVIPSLPTRAEVEGFLSRL